MGAGAFAGAGEGAFTGAGSSSSKNSFRLAGNALVFVSKDGSGDRVRLICYKSTKKSPFFN